MTFTPELERAAKAMYECYPSKMMMPVEHFMTWDEIDEGKREYFRKLARACWLSALPVSEAVVEAMYGCGGSRSSMFEAGVHAVVGKEGE